MGQAANVTNKDALDTVITNALIVDAVAGVIKADVGIKVGQVQIVHNFLIYQDHSGELFNDILFTCRCKCCFL